MLLIVWLNWSTKGEGVGGVLLSICNDCVPQKFLNLDPIYRLTFPILMLLQKFLCIEKHLLNIVVCNRKQPFGGYLKKSLTGHQFIFLHL